jgi:microcin C transport system permease protein
MIEQIKAQYGFDKSAPERFWLMLKGYLTLDFGTSFFKDKPVTQLLYEKMPVTISLGLWSTLLIYLVSIPLGFVKLNNMVYFLIKQHRSCWLLAMLYRLLYLVYY